MTRTTRKDRLLALLLSRKGQRVPCYLVQHAAGLQHGARILELRREGYQIDNTIEHQDGEVHSWYTLRACPGETATLFPLPSAQQPLTDDLSRYEVERMRMQRRSG